MTFVWLQRIRKLAFRSQKRGQISLEFDPSSWKSAWIATSYLYSSKGRILWVSYSLFVHSRALWQRLSFVIDLGKLVWFSFYLLKLSVTLSVGKLPIVYLSKMYLLSQFHDYNFNQNKVLKKTRTEYERLQNESPFTYRVLVTLSY